jgi:hypothetical protein
MELSQLYSPGTTMEEVDPAFKGMRRNEWLCKQVTVQFVEWDRRFRNQYPNFVPPLNRKAIATPRDNYGMKGI